MRALDVCRLMSQRTLHSAIKYAAKQGREQLADQVAEMLQAVNHQQLQRQAIDMGRWVGGAITHVKLVNVWWKLDKIWNNL